MLRNRIQFILSASFSGLRLNLSIPRFFAVSLSLISATTRYWLLSQLLSDIRYYYYYYYYYFDQYIYFFLFPNLFAICRDTFSKWCGGKRGLAEECSVAPLRNKRVKTLCGCREKRRQTREKYKPRLTTKAYKLSYNYIKYIITPVGRSCGKWSRRRLRSGGSRRVRRMSFGSTFNRTVIGGSTF
jgi:hypothetical protein